MSDDDKSKITALEAELGRIREQRKDAQAEVKTLTAKLSEAQGSANKFEAEVAKLQKKAAGIDAISEQSANKDAQLAELQTKLDASTSKSKRDLAMADAGYPAEARSYFAFQYEQHEASDDKTIEFDKYLEGLGDDPVAKAFKSSAEPAPATLVVDDATSTATETPDASGATTVEPTVVATSTTTPLPNTEAGVRPNADPGASSWAPGQSLRAAKENAVGFAEKHGIRVRNPERFSN